MALRISSKKRIKPVKNSGELHALGLRGERQPRAAVGVWGGKPQPSGPAPRVTDVVAESWGLDVGFVVDFPAFKTRQGVNAKTTGNLTGAGGAWDEEIHVGTGRMGLRAYVWGGQHEDERNQEDAEYSGSCQRRS
ncbi:hypothetical protein B0H16DRAFT_1458383 [Mycena metata]|uniref:Uncharacterized protein n=1 Tax=Mycena metata TaxID=1033252 RepID=A0AAD7NDA1_9AGAR|nr:hypothetical protein B0H16DRAFT_1458383 [Mycena metata]